MRKKVLTQYITSRVLVAHPEETAGDVLKRVKSTGWDDTQYTFVTDTQQQLKGYFPFYQLLQCKSDEKVADLMKPCHAVSQKHTLEYIATHAIEQNISAVPVTNEQGVFLGIIPPQTIIETLRKEHIEDLHKMAGIRKETTLARKAVEAPPLRSLKHRLPWLLVGLTGSFISTYLMAGYEQMLSTGQKRVISDKW